MTLQEMSHDYAASADAIGERIRQLHQRALTAPDPEEVLCLQRRIRELTPRQRQLLRMHFTQGKRVTDIAQELGISKSTVSRTLARCTQRLYRTLRYSL